MLPFSGAWSRNEGTVSVHEAASPRFRSVCNALVADKNNTNHGFKMCGSQIAEAMRLEKTN